MVMVILDLMGTIDPMGIIDRIVAADLMVAQWDHALAARFQAVETGADLMGAIIP